MHERTLTFVSRSLPDEYVSSKVSRTYHQPVTEWRRLRESAHQAVGRGTASGQAVAGMARKVCYEGAKSGFYWLLSRASAAANVLPRSALHPNR